MEVNLWELSKVRTFYISPVQTIISHDDADPDHP